ncbi:MAG: ABC transporter ATP-binding protein [Treponema sp.]|nr:ABC transporter ATP-binding protein [Treponema sp.]
MKFMHEYRSFIQKYVADKKGRSLAIVLNESARRFTLVIIPLLTQIITDEAIYKKSPVTNFYIWAVVLVLATFFNVIFNTFDYSLRNKTRTTIENEMKHDMISSVMWQDAKLSLGAVYERINNDTGQVVSFLINDLFKFLFNALYVAAVAIIMIRMNLILSLLIFVLFPLTIAINLIYAPVLEKHNKLRKKTSDDFNSHIETVYSANTTIKSYNIYSFLGKKTDEFLQKYKQAVFGEVRAVAFFDFFLLTFVLNLGTILPTTVGIYFVYKNILTIGEVTAFSLFCSRLWSPIEFFMDFPAVLVDRKNSFQRVKEVFDDCPKVSHDKFSLQMFNALEVKNLGFAIKDAAVFENVSLQINKGDKIAITGKNGSGKTSLGKMMVRLLDPTSGRIFYNGQPLDELSAENLREKIVYVPPRAFIFPFSLSENLFFDKDPGNIKIEDFAVLRQIQENHTDEKSLVNCSEGEKKIIEIFRALNKNAEVYIFDEPLAYLDKDNQQFFINLILQSVSDKTAIFITHEKTLVNHCGKVCELGGEA